MSALAAINHAQQQTLLNVLLEMRKDGISDLDIAIGAVRTEINNTHARFIAREKQAAAERIKVTSAVPCPQCGGVMVVARDGSRPVDAGDGMIVQVCRKCRYSRLVPIGEVS